MKKTKRKGFNFFRSYYDVYNELNDKDKVSFMNALLDRQFQGIKPNNLSGMAKFAYISQTNSIDSQVKGYEDKTGVKLGFDTPTVGGCQGGAHTPSLQVEEKEKEKEKVQDVEFLNPELKLIFDKWLNYRKEIKKPIKAKSTLKSLANKINTKGVSKSKAVISASIENGWQGLFWDRETEQPKINKRKISF